jgi:transposase-like protein
MQDIDTEIYASPTKCLCPRCRKVHIKKLNWIGRGVPRKFCGDCEWFVQSYDSAIDEGSRYYRPRVAPGFQPERRNTN